MKRMSAKICLGGQPNRYLKLRPAKRPVGASVVEMNVPYHSGSPDSFRIPDFGSCAQAEVTILVPDPLDIHPGDCPTTTLPLRLCCLMNRDKWFPAHNSRTDYSPAYCGSSTGSLLQITRFSDCFHHSFRDGQELWDQQLSCREYANSGGEFGIST